MRTPDTRIEMYSTVYLFMRQRLCNLNYNRMEFQTVKSKAERLMTLSQWIERMNINTVV